MRNLKPIYSQCAVTICGTEDKKDRNANDKLANLKLGRDDELGKLREGRKANDGIAKHSVTGMT
jgi:hypothetical protein